MPVLSFSRATPLKQLRRAVRNWRRGLARFRRPTPLNQRVATFSCDVVSDLVCLVSTKRGLYLLSHGELICLMPGHFWGVSTFEGVWYAWQRLGTRGRIVAFRLGPDGITDARTAVRHLRAGCHQIDFLRDRLHVLDTYHNRILIYRKQDGRLVLAAREYPAGRLRTGRDSPNYVHMNSLWCGPDGLFLLFKNPPGQATEIVRLNGKYRITARYATSSKGAHNLLRMDGEFLLCDSTAGALLVGHRIVFSCDGFTRGLSVTPTRVLVGKSYGKADGRCGAVCVLGHDYRLLAEVAIPGAIDEIRTVSETDYGLSNHAMMPAAAVQAPCRSSETR